MARPRKAEATSTPLSWGSDGYWHAYVYMGDRRPSGRPAPPRHVSARGCDDCRKSPTAGCKVCYEKCAAKVRDLESQRKTGDVVRAGTNYTLAEWLARWNETTVAGLRYGTRARGYGWAIKRFTGPDGIGHWKLADLEKDPGVIEQFLTRMATSGHSRTGGPLAAPSVEALHRDLRAALNEAIRLRVGINRNPCDAVKLPGAGDQDDFEVTPLFVEEVMRIMEVAETERNGSLLTVGFPLGARQGELLGMPWWVPPTSTRDKPLGINLDKKVAVIGRKAERRIWEHGCKDPVACARPHCRTERCKPGWYHGCGDESSCKASRGCWCPQRIAGKCRIHKSAACPSPCPPNCTRHAKLCKSRRGGCAIPGCNCSGITFGPVKSKAGARKWSLSDRQVEHLRRDKEQQEKEQELAADRWKEHGLVWCNPDGTPISPEQHRRWYKRVLRKAGVRDARVHDSRHTAATLLLLQGVDERIVLELMGWQDRKMLDRYQHVLDEMRAEAAQRLDDLLYRTAVAQDPAVTKALLEKAQADVARLTAEMRASELEAEVAKLRAELERYATDHATVDLGGNVVPFPRRTAV